MGEVEKTGDFQSERRMRLCMTGKGVDTMWIVWKSPIREKDTGKLLGEALHEETLLNAVAGREELVNENESVCCL